MTTSALQRAESLFELVNAAGPEAEAGQHLPQHVSNAFKEARLYRIALPEHFHGENADVATQIAVIEAISRADGAAGWNLMIGIENFSLLLEGFLDDREFLTDPNLLLASSSANVGVATPVEGGVEVSGRWQFASGCQNADWFGATVTLPDDQRRFYALLPVADVNILDTWNASGLRGSGSHDVSIEGKFVPHEKCINLGRTPEQDWPLYLKIPPMARLAYNKVGVALGLTHRLIEEFTTLATHKKPHFTGRILADRSRVQRVIAEAEATYCSSRAWVMELARELWDTVSADEPVTLKQRARLQLACSDAVSRCTAAADQLASVSGMSAGLPDSPLDRPLRDLRMVSGHLTVAPQHIDDAGRVLLGLKPEELMLAAPAVGAMPKKEKS